MLILMMFAFEMESWLVKRLLAERRQLHKDVVKLAEMMIEREFVNLQVPPDITKH